MGEKRGMLMRKGTPFIKGHMGGNEILLLPGDTIPAGRELEIALQALHSPSVKEHEVGFLYQGKTDNSLKVRIVGGISRRFISSCGGLTQVLGKAVIVTDLVRDFGLHVTEPMTTLSLETDAGLVRLHIKTDGRKVKQVLSDMNPFIDECYTLGIEPIKVEGVPAMRIGKFLTANADDIRQAHPDANFEDIDTATLHVLKSMQEAFDLQRYQDRPNADFAVYALNPVNISHTGRAIFPHVISYDCIEPACGTGTLAIGLSLIERGEIKIAEGRLQLAFESGGSPSSIGGPDLTRLQLTVKDGKVAEASFSHSLVEILATGQLWIR